jgi:hypothetical protein
MINDFKNACNKLERDSENKFIFPLKFKTKSGDIFEAFYNERDFWFVDCKSKYVYNQNCDFPVANYEQFKQYIKEGEWTIITSEYPQTTKCNNKSDVDDYYKTLPIKEYTREVWETALKEKWKFKRRDGEIMIVDWLGEDESYVNMISNFDVEDMTSNYENGLWYDDGDTSDRDIVARLN